MEQQPSPRARNVAVLLPLLGTFLWMPPFILLFGGEARPGGIPLVVAYLFGVWGVLLTAAFVLARVLRPPPGTEADGNVDGEDAAQPPA